MSPYPLTFAVNVFQDLTTSRDEAGFSVVAILYGLGIWSSIDKRPAVDKRPRVDKRPALHGTFVPLIRSLVMSTLKIDFGAYYQSKNWADGRSSQHKAFPPE